MASCISSSAATGLGRDIQESSNEYKIVLIGQTGAGKTSFLELLLNYAQQEEGDRFDLTKVSSHAIESPVKFKKKNWYSDTKESKSYKATFGQFHLVIIDTPGLQDTGGSERAKKNTKDIIKFVRKEKYINCICLIINASNCRLGDSMKDLIEQIVSILPSLVLDKIVCVCTYARNKWRASFDCQVLEQFHLVIPKERRFYLDNPFAVYKKVLEPDAEEVEEVDKEDFTEEFSATRKVVEKIFRVIKTMNRLETGDFGIFREFCEEVRLSFAILVCTHVNRNELDRKIQIALSEGGSQLHFSYSEVTLTGAPKKSVYCTSCRKNCHQNCDCFLAFIFISACRNITRSDCKVCGHHSSRHNRTKHCYTTRKVSLTVEENDCEEKLGGFQEKAQTYRAEIEAETYSLKSKLKTFQCIGSHFAVSDLAKTEIEVFKADNESIKGYVYQEEIKQLLDSTHEVIADPYRVENGDTKFRWACGMLGANPDKFSKENISSLYQQQLKAVHPGSTQDAAMEKKYLQLRHAKEYLEAQH